jgi:hypothetical protein
MSGTAVAQVLVGDCLEATFPRHYQLKAFLADASRLRDLARKQARGESLTEDEQREVPELRKRLRRADADAVLLTVIKTRQAGGLLFF